MEAIPYQKRVAFLLGATSNLIGRGGSRLFRERFGLGLTEARLLYVLGYETDLTAGRASHIMGIDKGATSRALAALESRKLARTTVAAADGRQRGIEMTAAGKKLRGQLMGVALEREGRMLAHFSATEVETFSALLQRLLQRLRGGEPSVRGPKPISVPDPVSRSARIRDQAARPRHRKPLP